MAEPPADETEMNNCEKFRSDLVDLVTSSRPPEAALGAHVSACPVCTSELEQLRAAWHALPASIDAEPPAALRREVLTLARERLDARAPAATRNRLRRAWRPVMAASLATFLGYVALSLVWPLREAVAFCQLSLLGAQSLPDGQLCLIYLGAAALYAGLPAAAAAWRWTAISTLTLGLTVTAIVSALLVPVVGLHIGTENLFITLSVLAGVALGAFTGTLSGGWLRRATPVRA